MGSKQTSFDPHNLINTAVFHVADTACFIWRNMDDAYIIYDKRSGHSQAMNDFAREIFAIIEEKPSSLLEIRQELESLLEKPLGGELMQKVVQTLVEFDKMGLIEPIVSDQEI